ncbi:MAG: hypothetical protein HUU50_19240 [Candidatus Brocadiae bacterium]|nr:hypothetical protein [Candidatus Brocadiia bacterium]
MTKIPVKCKCGKVLYVPNQYSGKKGRCPQCARLLIVPEMKPEKAQEIQQPSKACPTCGAYLSQEDEICVSCKMNLRTGHWDMAEKPPDPAPQLQQNIKKALFLYVFVSLGVIGYLFLALKKAHSVQIYEEKLYLEAKEKKQKEKNPFRLWWHWFFLEKVITKREYKDTINQELLFLQGEMDKFLREQKEEFHQLFQERRMNEVITRVTPRILNMLGECWQPLVSSSREKETWCSLLALYEKFSLEAKKDTFANDPKKIPSLDIYKKQFARDLAFWKKHIQKREYDEVQKKIESLWQSIHAIDYLDPEEPLVVEMRLLLKEVQSIKALFSIANEGAKNSTGLKKSFATKERQIITGTVVQYLLGNFYIKTDENKTITIALKNLQPEEIVFFALKSQRNKHIYQYAGIFYLYEKFYPIAQESFIYALKHGADPVEIQYYIKTVQELAIQGEKN